MALSENQIAIIAGHPLNDALKDIRVQLCDCADESLKSHVAVLLNALINSPAAIHLYTTGENMAEKLFPVWLNLRQGNIEPEKFRPLIDAVVTSATDKQIWAVVIDLTENLSTLSRRASSILPTFEATPVKTSSSRLADSETRTTVESELFQEIKNCTFRSVKGFCEKFFDTQSWSLEQRAMLTSVMAAHDGSKWKTYPSTPDERSIWDWLKSLEKRSLVGAPYQLYTSETAHQFKGQKGQMDLFFQTPGKKQDATFEYRDLLVIGEHKKSYNTGRFKADLLQLARYIRGVFTDQPTRRFVHAFTLCASMMELWVFDRSGPYSSGPFDIHRDPHKFARALVGYATMNDEAMGLDKFIEREGRNRYVTLDDLSGNEVRITLGRPLIRQKAIVCRGTTCFTTRSSQVAKFSWASDKRQFEVEQLKLAEERGVKGITRVVAHRKITTIATLRQGLQFITTHPFRKEDSDSDDPFITPPSTNQSHYKRKPSSDHTAHDASRPKKVRSGSQDSKLSSGRFQPSLYTSSEDLWDNRIFSCLVVSPAGRVISDFRTLKELLQSLRDAIKAHQSLYVTGNILHRDISPNNIIITNPEAADGFRGMLIDLDLAKIKDSGPSGARHQTGTMQFMAVEVLRKVDHTYRHDLESFFYVLLWMCARQSWVNGLAGGEQPPQMRPTRDWEFGSFDRIASAKEGHMSVNGLDGIMLEFPEPLKPEIVKSLCSNIRNILFPYDKDHRMSTGTPTGDSDQLYRPLISAFDEAISQL